MAQPLRGRLGFDITAGPPLEVLKVTGKLVLSLSLKGKGHFLFNVGSSFSTNETAINGSRRCTLYPPLPLSVLCFTGIQSYSYTDQRKVEADVEVTEDRTGDLSLRKPRTSQLSQDCFACVLRLGMVILSFFNGFYGF